MILYYDSNNNFAKLYGFYGVTVSTLDFESSNPSSNLGRTLKISFFLFIFSKISITNKTEEFLMNNHSIDIYIYLSNPI